MHEDTVRLGSVGKGGGSKAGLLGRERNYNIQLRVKNVLYQVCSMGEVGTLLRESTLCASGLGWRGGGGGCARLQRCYRTRRVPCLASNPTRSLGNNQVKWLESGTEVDTAFEQSSTIVGHSFCFVGDLLRRWTYMAGRNESPQSVRVYGSELLHKLAKYLQQILFKSRSPERCRGR